MASPFLAPEGGVADSSSSPSKFVIAIGIEIDLTNSRIAVGAENIRGDHVPGHYFHLSRDI